MSKESFNGKEIGPVFIEMRAKSMAERMAGDPWFPAQETFLVVYVAGKEKSINGLSWIILLWKEPADGSAGSAPVLREDEQGIFRKDGKAVRAILAMRYVDAHV